VTDETGSRDGVLTRELGGLGWSPLQAGAIAGSAGLVGSYAVPWVDVTGVTITEGTPTAVPASEVSVVPELLVGIGVVVSLLAVVRWTPRARGAVLVGGLASVGLALYTWFALDSSEAVIRVGEHVGPPGSFEPGVGLILALGASLAVVATSFLGLLQALPER
jgi:hypothetical protein